MSIFAGMPDPREAGFAFQQGFQQAKAEKQQEAVRGALSAYAMNPDDEGAFQVLAQHAPEFAIQVGHDRAERQQRAQVADLQRLAAGGDRAAMAELAGIDLDAWDKLADNDRQATTERASVIGQAALRISQLPPEQRPAAWDHAVDQLSPRYPELQQYKGRYSEEALMGAIDSAKLVNDFFALERPRYQAIPEGGTLVNTSDPAAVQSFTSGQGAPPVRVSTPQEASQLPPGTRFIDPNGVERVVPGGAGGNASGNFRGEFRGLAGETITSTYRTPSHNREVGGVENSFHTRRDAQGRPLGRDSVPPRGMTMSAYVAQLRRLNPDMDVINEGDHAHMEPKG